MKKNYTLGEQNKINQEFYYYTKKLNKGQLVISKVYAVKTKKT